MKGQTDFLPKLLIVLRLPPSFFLERVKVVLGDSVTVMIKRIFKFQKLKPAL